MQSFWDFLQNEILKMASLERLVNALLGYMGVSVETKWGASLSFFIYDTIKISILLCVLIFIISYIQSFFPPERTKKILSHFKGITANILAALLGTVTPFCSCSSIPLFIGFTGAGLPVGVTFSFLISSPMVDLGSLVLLMTVFGARVAVVYVLLGLVIAVAGGTLIEKMGMEDYVEDFIKDANAIDISEPDLTRADRIRYAFDKVKETFKKVFPYILIGVLIGSIIHNQIPRTFVEGLLGENKILSVLLATLVGVPMYADIFGAIPVAEALYGKGAYIGTVLAFMMAVTTLSLPSMIMLKQAIKPRLLGVFVIVCTVGIVIVGYLFNLFAYLIV